MSIAQILAIDGMFKIAAYTENAEAAYTAFKNAFGIGDSGETHTHSYTSQITTTPTCTTAGIKTYTCSCGHNYTQTIPATGHNYVDGICSVCGAVDPNYNPNVTLTSISATYSGGDVAVGTALTDLTGIVVTAHYSDGTNKTVTGYTLSGAIAEGENTITVSYGGKTATFTVTGVAESGGIVNLFDKNTMVVSGAFVGVGGAINNGATSKYAKIPISAGTYAIQKGSGWGMSTTGHPAFVDADGKVLANIGNLAVNGGSGSVANTDIATYKKASGNNGISVTVLSEKVTHFIFSICVNGGVDDTDSTMMEVGDTCHDYVAYA